MTWDQSVFDEVYNKRIDGLRRRFGHDPEPSHVQRQGPYVSWSQNIRVPTIYEVVVYTGAAFIAWLLYNMCIVSFERHFRARHRQQDPAIQAAGFYTRRRFCKELLVELLLLPLRIVWAIVVFIARECARIIQPFLSVYSLVEDLILCIPQIVAFLWRYWVESRAYHALLRWWRSLSKAAVVVRILLLIFGLWYWNREFIFISRDLNKSSYIGRTYTAPPPGGQPSHSQRPAVFSKVVDGTTVPNFGSAGPGFPPGARWRHHSDEPMTFDLWVDEHCTEVVPHHTFCYETPVAQLRPGTTETPIWKSTSGEPFPNGAITTSNVDFKPTVDSQAHQTPSRPDSKHVEQTILVSSNSGSSHSLFPGSDSHATITSTRTWDEEAQDNYRKWQTSQQEESTIFYTSEEVHEYSDEVSFKAKEMLSDAASTSIPRTVQDHSGNFFSRMFYPHKSTTSSLDKSSTHPVGSGESNDLIQEETFTMLVQTGLTSVWGPTPDPSSESPETVTPEIKYEYEFESASSHSTPLPAPGSGIQAPLLTSESMLQPSSKTTSTRYRPTPLLSRVVERWPTLSIPARLSTWPSIGPIAWPTFPLLKRPWADAESTAVVEQTPEVDYKTTPYVASTSATAKSQSAPQHYDMKHRPATPNMQFDERITEDLPFSEQGAKQAQEGGRPIIRGPSDSSSVVEETYEEEQSSSDFSTSRSSSFTSDKISQHKPATPDTQFDERLTENMPLSEQEVKKAQQGARPVVRGPSDSSFVTKEKFEEEQSSSDPSFSSERSKSSTLRKGSIYIPAAQDPINADIEYSEEGYNLPSSGHVASTKKASSKYKKAKEDDCVVRGPTNSFSTSREPADAQPAPRPEYVTPKEELADSRYDESASYPPSPEPAMSHHESSEESTGPEMTDRASSTVSSHFKPRNLFSTLREAFYPSSKTATETIEESEKPVPSPSSDTLLDEDFLSEGEEEEIMEEVHVKGTHPEPASFFEEKMEHLRHASGQHEFEPKLRGTNLEEHPEAEYHGESFHLEYTTPEPIKRLHESVEHFKQDSAQHKFPPPTFYEKTVTAEETVVHDGTTTEAESVFVSQSTEKPKVTLKKQSSEQDESISFDSTLPDGRTAEFNLNAEDPSAHEELKKRVMAAGDGVVEFEFEGKATRLTRRKTATEPASGAELTMGPTGAAETVKVETVDWKYCRSCRQAHCCEWEEDGTVRRLF